MITPGRAGRAQPKQPQRVDGLRETRANLRYVPDAVKEVFAERFKQMGETIQQRAIEKAPRGATGELKNIGMNTREDGLQVAIGSGQYYARFVEFGTSRSKKKPFLYPAFRLTVRDFRRQAKADGEKIRTKVRRNYKGPKPKAEA